MFDQTRIITAALPFANAIPHLGNIIGSHLPADIFTRFCRMKGYKTYFIGGMDEHGTAIEFAALKKNIPVKIFCDELYAEHTQIYNWFEISYDIFSRTSNKIHHETVRNFFKLLYNNGFIKEESIEIPYSNSLQRSIADRYIEGICPKCNYDHANGDQCDKCGSVLEPKDLINPYCTVDGSTDIDFIETNHLFLDLSIISDIIKNWIEQNHKLNNQVKKLSLGWIKQGIKPRDIVRDLKWGVKIPLPGYEDKVFYVWFENLIGYISATKELLGKEQGEKLWKDSTVQTFYFVGKDNIAFHTIFWPGQIFGTDEYVLPYNVVGLQHLQFEGKKFSKSRGIGLFADKVINSGLPVDYWRFYLSFIMPDTKDTDFYLEDFKERINKELISNFGNFINRTIGFAYNKLENKIPSIKVVDKEFESTVYEFVSRIENFYENCEFRLAIQEILKLTDYGNQQFTFRKPWETFNTDDINYLLEVCRISSILASPILVNSSKKILNYLNIEDLSLQINREAKFVNQPELLYKSIELEDIEKLKF